MLPAGKALETEGLREASSVRQGHEAGSEGVKVKVSLKQLTAEQSLHVIDQTLY